MGDRECAHSSDNGGGCSIEQSWHWWSYEPVSAVFKLPQKPQHRRGFTCQWGRRFEEAEEKEEEEFVRAGPVLA